MSLTRRSILKTAPFLAGLPLLGRAEAQSAATDRPDLIVAHLTDIHFGVDLLDKDRLKPGVSAQGLAATIRHAQAQGAQLILQGGDLLAEAFNKPADVVRPQIEGAVKVFAQEAKVPVRHAIGNHDIWGWDKKSSGTTGNEPLWGKKWIMQALKMDKPYYSFDQGKWHFVVLDDIQPGEDRDYVVKLDSDQMSWLKDDLAANAQKPTALLSHAPIFAVTPFLDGSNNLSGDWKVSGSLMHLDAPRLKSLFKKNPQVKLTLSGHTHLIDQVLLAGVVYANDGAVSAGSWYNNIQDTAPGYGLIKLWNDGRVKVEYVPSGFSLG
ncbi:metallophosphoesterase family protein [Deinococcus sp. PESE-13]